jgi:hypothetical protein
MSTPPFAPPVAMEGSEMQRPTESCSTSMRQPWPAIFGPPMIASSGTNTSLPWIGPFWNGPFSGKCRRPIVMPAVSRGHQRDRDAVVGLVAADELRGSNRRNARPMMVAIGASVM